MSCKVSNAVLIYLERQREDLSFIYEASELPDEFLRDSSYWMDAAAMETFLFRAAQSCSQFERKEEFFEAVGHACPKLAAWGVLDSVLKMMPRPQDILKQPERVLSYFISPEPPIASLTSRDCHVSFDLPLSTDQYPAITAFMKAAFESLPGFVGQPFAEVQWEGIHFEMNWSDCQSSLFDNDDLGHSISPDLMGNIIDSLEKGQKQLEAKNKELLEKNEELEKAYKESQRLYTMELEKLRSQNQDFSAGESAAMVAAPPSPELKESLHRVSKELLRLNDYMVRAQQLVTLMLATQKSAPSVREAMRRVDWDYVKEEFPRSLQRTSEEVRRLRALGPQDPHKNPQQDLA